MLIEEGQHRLAWATTFLTLEARRQRAFLEPSDVAEAALACVGAWETATDFEGISAALAAASSALQVCIRPLQHTPHGVNDGSEHHAADGCPEGAPQRAPCWQGGEVGDDKSGWEDAWDEPSPGDALMLDRLREAKRNVLAARLLTKHGLPTSVAELAAIDAEAASRLLQQLFLRMASSVGITDARFCGMCTAAPASVPADAR